MIELYQLNYKIRFKLSESQKVTVFIQHYYHKLYVQKAKKSVLFIGFYLYKNVRLTHLTVLGNYKLFQRDTETANRLRYIYIRYLHIHHQFHYS